MINLFLLIQLCVNLQLNVTFVQYVSVTLLQITFLFFTVSKFSALFRKEVQC